MIHKKVKGSADPLFYSLKFLIQNYLERNETLFNDFCIFSFDLNFIDSIFLFFLFFLIQNYLERKDPNINDFCIFFNHLISYWSILISSIFTHYFYFLYL
jgi:hypothetical protein